LNHATTSNPVISELAVRRLLDNAKANPVLVAAGLALSRDRVQEAEPLLRSYLHDNPYDVAAIRMMAELATRLGRFADAERLLNRALELAPSFVAARELLARNLQRLNRAAEALSHADILVSQEPKNPSLSLLKAALLVKVGDQQSASEIYGSVLKAYPRHAKGWMSYGHTLKTLGLQSEGVAAYRRAIQECPTLGEAWWSLANLKTVTFSAEDAAAMEQALAEASDDDDKMHLHFALGKAREDAGAYGAAFDHWADANAIRRRTLPYDARETRDEANRAAVFFTKDRLSLRAGCPAPDPIFIVGLPRSGSTLVEQILASHSQVEGTQELPEMMAIASRLSATTGSRGGKAYPDLIADLDEAELRKLGEEYLERTRVYRGTNRPYFIDKMPNNWMHVGLIQMILPNARIIDARRHPMACCLSVWKQHFARGQAFGYDLADIANYYRDYAALMDHFDRERPGAVHRVLYERMVADTEGEVRRLLAYLDLPFEDACLAFWKNDRAVRTASSEQVRSPIFKEAVDHWRHFEPWLDPVRQILGPLLQG